MTSAKMPINNLVDGFRLPKRASNINYREFTNYVALLQEVDLQIRDFPRTKSLYQRGF